MDTSPHLPRVWLENAYRKKRAVNSAYSLRAFARFLGVPSGRLSEVMSSKRLLTDQAGRKIAAKLALRPDEEAKFLKSIQNERALNKQRSISVATSDSEDTQEAEYHQLNLDAFQAIADWYHFAILSLMETRGFRNDPAWIAKRLGISVIESRAALERMIRLGMIETSRGGILKKSSAHFSTTHDVSSSALRVSHRQSLEQAINALENIEVELRDISSITMAIDIAKIPEAKKLLREFRRKLSAFLETGKQNEVYNLNIQLVPVSVPEKGAS
jgi:uncharacterized protein (TIGR02147 family)